MTLHTKVTGEEFDGQDLSVDPQYEHKEELPRPDRSTVDRNPRRIHLVARARRSAQRPCSPGVRGVARRPFGRDPGTSQ
jgi:hypothetical protein